MNDAGADIIAAKNKARKLLERYTDYKPKERVEIPKRVELAEVKIEVREDKEIIPNEEQSEMISRYDKGDSFIVLGSAGSGKSTIATTMIKAKIEQLPKTWELPADFYKDNNISTKHKYIKPGLPGFIIITFTNRAGETDARMLNLNLQLNQYNAETDTWETHLFTGEDFCNTAHATLAYQLVDVTGKVVDDAGNEEDVTKKTFKATRTMVNKLCPNIVSVLIDEAGMLSVTHFRELMEAFWTDRIQLVQMGDLSQLPAVGETSSLIASLNIMDAVKLTETWRFGGILLNWNTDIRTKELVIPKWGNKDRSWNKHENGDNIDYYRTKSNYIIDDKFNGRSIYNFFFSEEEAKTKEKALTKVCKLLTQYILTGKFYQGIDLVIIPQHVGIMGGYSVFRIVDGWLDHAYGRSNYLLNYSSGKAVIAVGDVMLLKREQAMIVGIEATNNYKGLTTQEGKLYPTRDADVWLDLHEAHGNKLLDNSDIDSLIEEFSTKSMADLEIAEASLDSLLEDADDFSTEAGDYSETVPRQLSHKLLVLDLSKLLIHLSMKYSPSDAYKLATNFVSVVKAIAINLDAKQREHTIRFGHLTNLTEQIEMLAEFYDLKEWVKSNLKTVSSSNEFPNMGDKPGYQPGYFTGYQVQGSECPKVFVVGHRKGYRSNMTSNEYLYTANTRATRTIINVCDERLLNGTLTMGGINYQTYKGITIEEKQAAYLKVSQNKVASPDMEVSIEFMQKLTYLNKYKEGGKWWDAPKFSVTNIRC